MCYSKNNKLETRVGDSNLEIDIVNACNYEEIANNVTRSSNDFSMIQLNIRGISSKIGDLKYLIDKTFETGHPDCVLLCETWLCPNSPPVNIAGYRFVHTDRINKKGGGVDILISDSTKFKERTDIVLENNDCESCFIEVQTRNKPLIVGSIYRPPNSSIETFVSQLELLLKKIKTEGNKHIIVGLDHNLC